MRADLFAIRRPFLWALGVSLLAHLAALLGPHIHLPEAPPPRGVFQARLEKLPLPPVKQTAAPKPQAKPVPEKPAAKRAPVPMLPPAPTPAKPVAVNPSPISSLVPSRETARHAPPSSASPASFDAAKALPLKAEMRYDLYKGDKTFLGDVASTLEIKDGSYKLSTTIEARGLASLMVSGKWIQISEGTVDEKGLRPRLFKDQNPKKGVSEARFDWEARQLTLSGGRTEALPDKTQDSQSFIYQFAFDPPKSGVVKFAFTNGRKLDYYIFDVKGVESIELPAGTVRALHLSKQHSSDEEGTEIWLDTGNHYLPVLVRQLEKDGSVKLEQVINSIKTH